MNRTASILFLTFFLFVISVSAQSSVNVGNSAPLFSGTSLDGASFDLHEFRGSVVVVTFWSTRCEICRSEIPRLNTFTDRFDPSKVVFLALTMEHEDKIAGYLRANPFKFRIVPDSFGTVLQYADRSKSGFVDMGFPSFFVVDQNGVVQFKASGYDKTPMLDAAINRLISK